MTQRDMIRAEIPPVTVTRTAAPVVDLPWSLAILGEGVAALHRLPPGGVVSIGRSSEATVPIRHPSLSRRHAVLNLGLVVTVEDLGSRNGTVLAGRRLLPGETRVVRPGDVLQVGAVSITLIRADRPR
jgi:two-component system, NtrC family, response regulator AtoC